jgi:hypothetical protein
MNQSYRNLTCLREGLRVIEKYAGEDFVSLRALVVHVPGVPFSSFSDADAEHLNKLGWKEHSEGGVFYKLT